MPTASLEVILNQKPAHLEVLGVAIKTFMRIKDQFQNNFCDGRPLDNRANSHLRKLNQFVSQISHEGQPLDLFTSDYRKVPFYNWNPPACDTLVAVHKNDIDDKIKIDDFAFVDTITQNNIDCNWAPVDGYVGVTGNGQLHDNDITNVPVDGYIRVPSGRHVQTNYDRDLSPADGYVKVTGECLDNDVTNVPVDGYVRVLSDRQIHSNLNPAINDDTDVLVNAINDDTDVRVNTQDTDVLVNAIGDDTEDDTEDPTVMYHAERSPGT